MLPQPGVTEAHLEEFDRLLPAKFHSGPRQILTDEEKEAAAKSNKAVAGTGVLNHSTEATFATTPEAAGRR
jgi:hypothetical protein